MFHLTANQRPEDIGCLSVGLHEFCIISGLLIIAQFLFISFKYS